MRKLTVKIAYMRGVISMGDTIVEKTEGRLSYHDSVEEMIPRIRKDGMSNVWDRYAQ